MDCRISAYPRYTDFYINRTGIAPFVLLVDIDRLQFETIEQFELSSAKTRSNFQKIIGSQPTRLWTGGGHHYIQPQSAIVLEKIEGNWASFFLNRGFMTSSTRKLNFELSLYAFARQSTNQV